MLTKNKYYMTYTSLSKLKQYVNSSHTHPISKYVSILSYYFIIVNKIPSKKFIAHLIKVKKLAWQKKTEIKDIIIANAEYYPLRPQKWHTYLILVMLGTWLPSLGNACHPDCPRHLNINKQNIWKPFSHCIVRVDIIHQQNTSNRWFQQSSMHKTAKGKFFYR